jgi:aminoglycoside phosphotransferase (APT) family kinase protein
MHTDQIDIPISTVQRLVRDQFPAWAEFIITKQEVSGTVNSIFRIGEHLVGRFPLKAENVAAVTDRIRAEHEAALRIARASPVAVPMMLGLGRPGHGYPLPWSVHTWLPGTTATSTSVATSTAFARDLAELVSALRQADRVANRNLGHRGQSLVLHDDWVSTSLRRSRGLLNTGLLADLWTRYRELPAAAEHAMSHTDLIPANVLTQGERLTGVLDVGAFGPADPAVDLVPAWHLLASGPRAGLRGLVDIDDSEWERGKAWAFEQALGALWYYLDSNPAMRELGTWTLLRIVAAETGDPALLAPAHSPVWDLLHGGPDGSLSRAAIASI